MKTDLEKIQSIILQTVQRIHDFCEEHQITYFLIGGGLIGAVRHGGPIPWDDDIDIGMPRPDYERFIRLASSIGDPYVVSTLHSDPDYIYGFAKCYDTRTSVTEDLSPPFTRGVWVDIFPMDGTFDNPAFRRLHFAAARGLKAVLASRCGAFQPSKQRRLALLARRTVALISHVISIRALHRLLHAVLRLRDYRSSNLVGNMLGRWGARELGNRSALESQIDVPYAGHTFKIPAGYHEYLNTVYGDYMKLPPEEGRVPDHSTNDIYLDQSYLAPSRGASTKQTK